MFANGILTVFLLACGPSGLSPLVSAFSPSFGRSRITAKTTSTRTRRSPSPARLAATPEESESTPSSSLKDEFFNRGNIDPFASMAASAMPNFFAASVLLGLLSPLPPPEAWAAAVPPVATYAAPRPVTNGREVSVDVDLRSVPALSEKVFVNRDALTKLLLESAKSLKPVLDLLTSSDAVSIRPPSDLKGAARDLASGEAQFIFNGNNLVDVRVESVQGALIVRIVNPNIPRVPFLRDGAAAMKFVDGIVDAAPVAADDLAKLERAGTSLGRILTWGAPDKAAAPPISYGGSALDRFLSSNSGLGGLSNFQVIAGTVGSVVTAAYGVSYSYYVSMNEELDRAAAAKKEKLVAAAAAKKEKQVAAAAAKKEKEKQVAAAAKREKEAAAAEEAKSEADAPVGAADESSDKSPSADAAELAKSNQGSDSNPESKSKPDPAAEDTEPGTPAEGRERMRTKIRKLFRKT